MVWLWPLQQGGHRAWEALGVPGFTFLPFGKTVGLGDWVDPHLRLEGSLSYLDLSSQGCLGEDMKQQVLGARD